MSEPIDPKIDALVKMQEQLAQHNIRSALIGGFTLSVWADPRVTKDVDLKVLLTRDEGQRLLDALGADYRTLQPDPLRALRRNGIVFVQNADGFRIDLMVAEAGFDQEVLRRARHIEILPDAWVWIATAEDIIIYKLLSPRLQDQADVENIIRVQGNALDDKYVVKTLREFENALTDSTLVATYQTMRKKHSS